MQDKNLVTQISALKTLNSKDREVITLAFFNVIKEILNLDYFFVVLDKDSYKKNIILPLIREYKNLYALQLFSSYERARNFVNDNYEMFCVADKKLIAKITKENFLKNFVPFLANQNLNYVINDGVDDFVDTFYRLELILENDDNYKNNLLSLISLKEKNLKQVYEDMCKKYIELV